MKKIMISTAFIVSVLLCAASGHAFDVWINNPPSLSRPQDWEPQDWGDLPQSREDRQNSLDDWKNSRRRWGNDRKIIWDDFGAPQGYIVPHQYGGADIFDMRGYKKGRIQPRMK